jgi:hypothetical protein
MPCSAPFDTWLTGNSRQRNDNGLYPFVEWMEYILGGMGAPGSVAKRKQLGPAVANVWHWSGVSKYQVTLLYPSHSIPA